MQQQGEQMKKSETTLCVSGQVVPYEWNGDLVAKVMLIDDNHREYRIDPCGRGRQLLEYADYWVEVEGVVRRRNGENFMTVTWFRLVDEFDEYADVWDGELDEF
jgi:hypothetical protein